MSWLTKIELDFETAWKRRLHDSYAWHQAAWEAFPGRDGLPRHFLSRLKVQPYGFELLLLSREPSKPPPWCPEGCFTARRVPPAFLKHGLYRFDLRANPTRKVAKMNGAGERTKNGKRVALLQPDAQRAWLDRKAENGGFRILDEPPLVIEPAHASEFRIQKAEIKGLHVGVDFRGVLQVTDHDRFFEAFHQGFGSAKAFGFGMMLLQPIH